MILYAFKVFRDLVPKPGFSIKENERIGPMMNINRKPWNCSVKNSVYDRNFLLQGAKLFNSLPRNIRQEVRYEHLNINSIKSMIDNFLKLIPDQPSCAKIPKISVSNSIINQAKLIWKWPFDEPHNE